MSALKVGSWVMLALAAGCVRAYEPPRSDQPHAIVKLRRSYDAVAGSALREVVDIEEHRALRTETAAALAGAPRTDSLLVHPLPGSFRFESNFFHHELRSVQESYTVQEPYTAFESYGCSTGFGTNQVHRTCHRSVTRYRSHTKYRTVMKNVEVSDGACEATLRFAPVDRHVYLVQYTYRAPGVCSLSCFEQVAGNAGEFSNKACPAAP